MAWKFIRGLWVSSDLYFKSISQAFCVKTGCRHQLGSKENNTEWLLYVYFTFGENSVGSLNYSSEGRGQIPTLRRPLALTLGICSVFLEIKVNVWSIWSGTFFFATLNKGPSEVGGLRACCWDMSCLVSWCPLSRKTKWAAVTMALLWREFLGLTKKGRF